MHTAKQPTKLVGPLGISAALHLSVVALALIAYRKQAPELLPPIYKVDIVAAPPGERAIGEVKPEEAPVVTCTLLNDTATRYCDAAASESR